MSEPRKEIIGDCELWLGDSFDLMPLLKSIDIVVTDPPYGVNKAEWDAEYPEWIEEWSLNIVKSVVIMPGIWALPDCCARLGDAYKGIISGRNLNGMTFGPLGFNNWIPAVCAGNIPRRGQDAFDFSIVNGDKPDHPSPKPLPYMLRLLDRVSEPEWRVLDPFMGSGTTGVAATKLGRAFTGIEREQSYFDIACRRIEEAYRQPRLFAEPAVKPVQAGLFESEVAG